MSDEKLDLDAIEARVKAATPGICVVPEYNEARPAYTLLVTIERLPDMKSIQFVPFEVRYVADARFYAAARADVLTLVDELRRLRQEFADWKYTVSLFARQHGEADEEVRRLGIEVKRLQEENEGYVEALNKIFAIVQGMSENDRLPKYIVKWALVAANIAGKALAHLQEPAEHAVSPAGESASVGETKG